MKKPIKKTTKKVAKKPVVHTMSKERLLDLCKKLDGCEEGIEWLEQLNAKNLEQVLKIVFKKWKENKYSHQASHQAQHFDWFVSELELPYEELPNQCYYTLLPVGCTCVEKKTKRLPFQKVVKIVNAAAEAKLKELS